MIVRKVFAICTAGRKCDYSHTSIYLSEVTPIHTRAKIQSRSRNWSGREGRSILSSTRTIHLSSRSILSSCCSDIRPNCVRGGGGGVAARTTTTTEDMGGGCRGWLNEKLNRAQQVARIRYIAKITRDITGFDDTRRRSREPGYYYYYDTPILQTPARSLTGRRRTETLRYVHCRSRECEYCAECARLRDRVGGLCPRRDPRRLPSAAERPRTLPLGRYPELLAAQQPYFKYTFCYKHLRNYYYINI